MRYINLFIDMTVRYRIIILFVSVLEDFVANVGTLFTNLENAVGNIEQLKILCINND